MGKETSIPVLNIMGYYMERKKNKVKKMMSHMTFPSHQIVSSNEIESKTKVTKPWLGNKRHGSQSHVFCLEAPSHPQKYCLPVVVGAWLKSIYISHSHVCMFCDLRESGQIKTYKYNVGGFVKYTISRTSISLQPTHIVG